jgi:hypothetical protein
MEFIKRKYEFLCRQASFNKEQMKRFYSILFFVMVTLKLYSQVNPQDTTILQSGELELITISPKEPEVVYGSKELNVADFVFKGDTLYLLAYEAEERWKRQEESKITLFNGCNLIKLDTNMNEVKRVPVPEISKGLFEGYMNMIFVEGRYNYYMHEPSLQGEFYKIDRDTFNVFIAPLIDTIGDYICFTTFDPNYPAFEYKTYNQVDSTIKTVRYLANDLVLELFRSEYKYLSPRDRLDAYKMELATGIEKEVIAAYMRGFQNSPYFEPVNAPMFVVNDTLLILDHYHDKLLKMEVSGELIDSVSIKYHHMKGPEKWTGKVKQDGKTRKIYTITQKGGWNYIQEIDTHNGQTAHSQRLHYKYVDQVKFHNGYVYYVYRPFESSQKRFLYREIVIP